MLDVQTSDLIFPNYGNLVLIGETADKVNGYRLDFTIEGLTDAEVG